MKNSCLRFWLQGFDSNNNGLFNIQKYLHVYLSISLFIEKIREKEREREKIITIELIKHETCSC